MIPQSEIFGPLAEIQEGSAVLGDVSDSSTGVYLPLAERAQLSLNNHGFI